MIHQRLKALVSIFSLVGVCALVACASEPEQKDQQLRKAEKAEPTVEVEKPSPEELAKSPCGNPDWAQLPPGAEDKAAEDKANDQPDKPEDDTNEDAAEEPPKPKKQSSMGEASANNPPCT